MFNRAKTASGPCHTPYATVKTGQKKKERERVFWPGLIDSNSQEKKKTGLLFYNESGEENKQNTFSYYQVLLKVNQRLWQSIQAEPPKA